VIVLRNRIRGYAWGSRTALAALLGRDVPSPGPEAELWLGAHPAAPSTMDGPDGEMSLETLIVSDPEQMLGPAVTSRFGARLPFLLKVLAVAEPLSLQAHPDAAQAAAGFDAEQAAGSVGRNYPDPYQKPELLVALEDFEALCGFRDPALTAKLLESFGVPDIAPVVDTLRTADPADGLREAVGMLLEWPQANRADLVTAVTTAGTELAAAPPDETLRRWYGLVADLGGRYPTDIGVVVALLLNHVRLRPGEAVFMPAGNLHAYLSGVGVEVMAASDNVLRGGLTIKHVDVPELLRVLRYEVLARPLVRAVELAPGLQTWPVPVSEFRLVRARPGATEVRVLLPGSGPRILICVRGSAELRPVGAAVPSVLRQGESVFIAAGEPPVEVSGDADVFQASAQP
jgi:mannose-6-phosphate isomerase